jgi:hypothetical protein
MPPPAALLGSGALKTETTRNTLPLGHGRVATDFTACFAPADPSTATITFIGRHFSASMWLFSVVVFIRCDCSECTGNTLTSHRAVLNG